MEMIETARNRWVPRAPSSSSVSNGSTDRKVVHGDITSRGASLVHIVGGGGRGGARGGVACKEAMKLLGSWCWTACCLYLWSSR
jgi:hypothetical protein